MIDILVTFLFTFWITCGIIYILKDMATPFSSSRSFLIVFNLIFSPYLLFSDIKEEWRENKEYRDKYK